MLSAYLERPFFKSETIVMNSVLPASNVSAAKSRVVVFGSFYRGFCVLSELLSGDITEKLTVVGVATDDSSKRFVSPDKRVWQYPHVKAEEEMVSNLARKFDIEIYNGNVKTPEFYDIFENRWKPDLCIMATFGQKINSRLFEAPHLGFYNLHPCIDDGWPSHYVGGNPFQMLLNDEKIYSKIAMHRVNDGFDTGEFIAYSDKVFFPAHASVIDCHKITSPTAGRLAVHEIEKIIDRANCSNCGNTADS
ncbi:MAG: formyltransferase family protein [Propionivibrio sp.]